MAGALIVVKNTPSDEYAYWILEYDTIQEALVEYNDFVNHINGVINSWTNEDASLPPEEYSFSQAVVTIGTVEWVQVFQPATEPRFTISTEYPR